MIFVTVGAQMPFDRLIRTVDEWAGQKESIPEVFAQIGPSKFQPQHIRWTAFLNPEEFRRQVGAADVIVAHAGMGSIITALEMGKPILVMPRRGDLGETRNDHQVATAKRFLELDCISVAFDEKELAAKLEQLDQMHCGRQIGAQASSELISALKKFINQDIKIVNTIR